MSLEKLKESWKDAEIDGAELWFDYDETGGFGPYQIGWQHEMGSNYICQWDADFHPEVLECLKRNFLACCKLYQ